MKNYRSRNSDSTEARNSDLFSTNGTINLRTTVIPFNSKKGVRRCMPMAVSEDEIRRRWALPEAFNRAQLKFLLKVGDKFVDSVIDRFDGPRGTRVAKGYRQPPGWQLSKLTEGEMQQIGKGIRDVHHAEFPVAPLADELLRTLTAKYDVDGAIEKLKSTIEVMTELEKIMNTEFAKRDDGKGMHIGTVKTLGDGIQMVSRLSHRLSPLMMKVCTETISDVLGSAAVHPDELVSDSDSYSDSDSDSESEAGPVPGLVKVKSSIKQRVNDYRLQRVLFGKCRELETKLLQEIGGTDEKKKKTALFSYLLLVTGLRQGRPRLEKKATTKDTEPFLGLVSVTNEHIELNPNK